MLVRASVLAVVGVLAMMPVVVPVEASFTVGGDTPAAISGGLSWAPAQQTDPVHGFTSVSCVSNQLCRAGDAGARVERWDGSGWTHGDSFPAETIGVTAMTCTTSAFCAAVQQLPKTHGHFSFRPVTRRPDGSWDLTAAVVPDGFDGGISCVGAGFCMLVDGRTHFQVWNGTSWSSLGTDSSFGLRARVSCASATMCELIDERGNVYRWNGARWSAPSVFNRSGFIGSIQCPTTTFCLAAEIGVYWVFDGHSWSTTKTIDHRFDVAGVSCPGPRFCLAVSDLGGSLTWTGSQWSTYQPLNGTHPLLDVSCADAAFCVAIDQTGRAFHRVEGTWQSPRPGDPALGHVDGLSCSSAELCVLVDDHEAAAAFTGSAWTDPRRVDDSISGGFSDVSCAGGWFCMASNDDGTVRLRRHGVWSARLPVTTSAPLAAVSCGSQNFCATAGSYGYIRAWTGTNWHTVVNSTDLQLHRTSLSCLPTDCVATRSEYWESSLNRTWSFAPGDPSATPIGTSPQAATISCVTPSYCMSVGPEGPELFDGSAWTPTPQPASGVPTGAVSCPSQTMCVAVGANSESTWNGTTWTEPEVIIDPGAAPFAGLTHLSCTPDICAAADTEGWTIVAINT